MFDILYIPQYRSCPLIRDRCQLIISNTYLSLYTTRAGMFVDIAQHATLSSTATRFDRLGLITCTRRRRPFVSPRTRIRRSWMPLFFPSLVSLFLSPSAEIAKRTRENDSMDKLARERERETREPVTRGRYFYESRGIRPKPAHFHVLFPSRRRRNKRKGTERE